MTSPKPPLKKESEEAPQPRPTRLLVVDDEPNSRELCKAFLETDGYEVHSCDSVRKAIAMLALKRFDLVLTDLSLPDTNGVELIKQVKYHYPSTDVIVMTAFGSVTTAVESMKAGAYDYITKPFPRDLLRATIKRALESHNLKREISKMQNELFKKDKLAMVGAMAGAIAHRMRNPLSIIQMCAQYLGNKISEKEYLQVLSAIEEKVKTLEGLTREFVDYSRASRIKRSAHSIEKLTDEMIKNVSPRSRIQGVQINRHYHPNLPVMQVDGELIGEVITNIIDNGLQAMKGPGQIDVFIEMEKAAKSVTIRIRNTGSVLPEELQEKIFEPFFTTKETGMGLGLAIVKQVIEGHGGRIQATGDPQAQTTTFRIQLPVVENQKAA
jgi:signal transduction histidine kinase